MSSNDFLEFDDDVQTQDSYSGRSPFAILAGALVVILILASICTVYLLSQRNQDTGTQAAAIEATNAVIAVTNEAVTQTIAAMQTSDAQPPTETPTPSPVATAVSTGTPTVPPTNTLVTQSDEEGDTGAEGEETPGEGTTVADGTIIASEDTNGDGTVDGDDGDTTGGTVVASTDNNGTVQDGTPSAAFDTTGTDGTLPQTGGLDTWAAILLAVFFIGLFVAARRLRS